MSIPKTIAIIGVGLIGGSLGMAIKKLKMKNEKLKIIGIGRHKHKLQLAKKLGIVDEYTTDFATGVKNADIVVVTTPVDTIAEIVKRILPYLKPNCIVTDVGSVKLSIVSEIEKLSSHCFFIGAHPLAGSEKSGVKFAITDLFKNATVVITPTKNTSKYALQTITEIWRNVGARILVMSPEEHDKLISITSHLPHVISSALVELVYSRNKKNSRTAKLLAGSFRDVTRISDSDPTIWSAICYQNQKELTKTILEYVKILKKVASGSTSQWSKSNLHRFFSKARSSRCQLLQSNQKKKSALH